MDHCLRENPEEGNWEGFLLRMAAVDDQDPLKYLLDLEDCCSDPCMKDDIQTLILLMSILRPFVKFLFQWDITLQNQDDQEFHERLKHIFSVVEKVGHSAFYPQSLPGSEYLQDDSSSINAEPVQVASILETLKSLKGDIVRIRALRPSFPDHMCVTRYEVENLICFIETLWRNLNDISIICKACVIVRVERELSDLERRLHFLATFLMISKSFLLFYNVKAFVRSAQILAMGISCNLFLCFLNDDDDHELATAGDHMKADSLPDVLRKINTLLQELGQLHNEYGPCLVRLPDDHYPTMDEHILGILDYLIHELRELSNNKSCSMVAVKFQIDILVDELSFIRSSPMDMLLQNSSEAMKSLRFSVEALIMKAGFFFYFPPDKMGDEEVIMVNYLSFGLPDLLQAVHVIHLKARELFLENYWASSWHFEFLVMGNLEVVDFLVKKLEGLLGSKTALIDALKSQIRMLHDEIVALRKCSVEMAEQMGNSQVKLLSWLIKAADEANYVIDALTAGETSPWLHKLGIFVMTQDIKILQKRVKTILSTDIDSDDNRISEPSIGASTQIFEPPSISAPSCFKDGMEIKMEEDYDELVGMKDAVAEIIGLLTEGSRHLEIVSIVGMPGLGKTALANAVYKHPCVMFNFHRHAWCCSHRVYQKENLLSSILGQISEEITNLSGETNGKDLPQMLYKCLKGRKYLIVIDDIWDLEAWHDLRECFPDDDNGSRILFTTRNHAVAAQAKSLPHALRLLSNEESCELLWLKLFRGESCPHGLSSILKHIAYSCKGLPLAVVLVAGILKRKEKTRDSWEQVAKTLIRSRSIQEKVSEVLDFSYKNLPDYLKACFHYFGTFPEGKTIVVSKLIRLWISEGFVLQPNQGLKSLKQEAESYLNDLIDRSLVMITRKSSTGGVKECRVHDILQEFCLAKLEKERYFTRQDISGGIAVLYGDYKICRSKIPFPPTEVARIHSLLYYNKSRRREDPSGQVQPSALAPRKRTPLSEFVFRRFFSPGKDYSSAHAAMFSSRPVALGSQTNQRRPLRYSPIVKYKYLRVLDLGNVNVQSSADSSDLVKISKLVHLTYLAVRIRTTKIPSEIGNLRNLETFHLSGAIGKVMLPESVWKLVNLRAVIMDHCFFDFQHYSREFFEHSSQLDDLRSISSICVWHRNVEKFMRKLSCVQKLGCIFSNSRLECYEASNRQDCYEANNFFKTLEVLHELQSLKMSFSCREPYPFQFSFPSNLKKLTMSKFRLSWDDISVIGQLPNLEVLKLRDLAFMGLQWDMKEGEFQKLKFLKLESLDIELWNASPEHLPCLEQLVVLSCKQLEEIPSSFGEIPTLQLIEMKWCRASAVDSVMQILEVQRDLSNDQLNVIVVGP